ncbi:MAG: hypothetical protein V4858_08825 [Pseudomonadota bacterium]
MDFDDLHTDKIEILKSDGTRTTGLKASVQKDKIFMNFNGVLVEPGDLVQRKMSNGAEETFRVIDPGFNEEFYEIPAGYQMDVRKLGLPEAKSAVQSITYNISGNNARVNQNSIDNSTNLVQIDGRVSQHITALRREIDESGLSAKEKADANEIVDGVDDAFQSGKPKKAVVTALLSALPHMANVASIVSGIVSLLPGGTP